MAAQQRKLRILLIGRGGREHALAWKLTRPQSVKHVYVAPENAGTEALPRASNCREVAENDCPGLVQLVQKPGSNLVVVGPDDAVVGGMGDHFRERLREGSHVQENIRTATHETFYENEYENVKAYLKKLGRRVVIKADGLAAGKGVVLPETPEVAEHTPKEIMLTGKFGNAGKTVIIEEYLEGYEISILTFTAFTDGTSVLSLPPGQDHRRAHDGNKGLNTGGMGVYAPLSSVSAAQMVEIEQTVILPTLSGLELDRIMMTPSGPKVLEYNARFGDPETQSMILLPPDETLPELLLACVENRLAGVKLDVSTKFACNITVAAEGYPGSYRKGDLIQSDSPPEGVHIFHAGTERINGELRTAGGRVFSVSSTGKTLEEAVSAAYRGESKASA